MTETKKCPDRTAWQLLLEGNLSEQTQQELTAHLDSCPACRQAVDQLAAAGQSWSKIPAALAKAGGQDVRLAEVMAQLKSDESKLGETLTQPGTADSQTGGMMQTSSTATPQSLKRASTLGSKIMRQLSSGASGMRFLIMGAL